MDQGLAIPALRALRRILRASDLASRQLAGATGLTLSQLLVLQEVAEQGETTPTALSSALQFSHATITNICDRLVALGMLTRARGEQDKRRVYLAPTERGLAAIESAPNQLQERFNREFSALPDWEQAMILAGLGRLADILGVAAKDAAPLLDSGPIDPPSGT